MIIYRKYACTITNDTFRLIEYNSIRHPEMTLYHKSAANTIAQRGVINTRRCIMQHITMVDVRCTVEKKIKV